MTDTLPKARLRPVIRVFVSSTFSDMRHERNALQELVYPKLELLCQQNGFQFQAIDLRWGVSSEAGLDHRTMRICFDELRRLRLYRASFFSPNHDRQKTPDIKHAIFEA